MSVLTSLFLTFLVVVGCAVFLIKHLFGGQSGLKQQAVKSVGTMVIKSLLDRRR
jgi:Na+-translocating ferredoxin:NAD+ oxidoreductase RnfD subunit